MFQHDISLEQAYSFSRLDDTCLLSTVTEHPFELEGTTWATAEHYYQAKKFVKPQDVEEITKSESGVDAYKLGNRWWKRGRTKDWKQKRRVMMTRALYTKVMAFDEVKEALLESGDERIVETSMYDPYWGIGRDQRGENMLGQIWMDIRAKVRADIRIKAHGISA
jgi:ribA/ribD-fused uncharacterized protein